MKTFIETKPMQAVIIAAIVSACISAVAAASFEGVYTIRVANTMQIWKVNRFTGATQLCSAGLGCSTQELN